MDFTMTRNANNLKVFKFIILSVFIFMVNFKFAISSFASRTFMGKILESKIPVASNSRSIRRMIFPSRIESLFNIKSDYFLDLTLSRAMNSIIFTWPNKKFYSAFRTNLFNFISRIEIMKTSFTAKQVILVKSINFERFSALFADFWFSDLPARFSIALLRAIYLPLIVTRDFLMTPFTVHIEQCLRNTLISQPTRS